MPAWNDERTVRLLVKLIVTQSPAATCSTSGSGLNVIGEAGEPETNAPFGPFTPWERLTSTAETGNAFAGAPAGHGLPGAATTGGRPPVCGGRGGAVARGGRPRRRGGGGGP